MFNVDCFLTSDDVEWNGDKVDFDEINEMMKDL
jgi:hypothetical protein